MVVHDCPGAARQVQLAQDVEAAIVETENTDPPVIGRIEISETSSRLLRITLIHNSSDGDGERIRMVASGFGTHRSRRLPLSRPTHRQQV
jgi:hypothetical protein